ncbi:MAG TPA: tRNA dihydrouridine(20/20a) synthase DusA, partial [Fluviicoccus sp.]|nr:tRNA dihydrouridine(20/20a) synthase DusA [Fluviicoccus sp.]
PLNQMTRHILGLFQGLPGARRWRQHLSTHAHLKHRGIDLVEEAAGFIIDKNRQEATA